METVPTAYKVDWKNLIKSLRKICAYNFREINGLQSLRVYSIFLLKGKLTRVSDE